MPYNPVAENVLGTIGTICWTIQLVPQLWKSWRTKSTDGLSEYLMFLWGASGAFFGVYAIVQDLNVPLIVQPQLLAVLSYFSFAQCQYYGRKRSKLTSLIMYAVLVLVSGGFEAGMVFALKSSDNHGHSNMRAVQFFGAFSTVLLSVALLPQYYEIYKYKEVVGISILFMLVDMLGGVFSDLSISFKGEFDVVAGVTYTLVIVLDGIVILCAIILNPRAARRRKGVQSEANGDGAQRAESVGEHSQQLPDGIPLQPQERLEGTNMENGAWVVDSSDIHTRSSHHSNRVERHNVISNGTSSAFSIA